jgi:hypothetical protein
MKVGLFIPCYIDQFYPNVGVATCNYSKNWAVMFHCHSIKPVADNQWLTGGDVSYLMHPGRILKRQHSKIKTIHIAEMLNAG